MSVEILQTIEAFLRVIDKFINLLKRADRDKQQLFKEFVEPLFVELQPVVDDYFTLFLRSRELVRNEQKQNLKKAVEEIVRARDHLLRTRIKIIALATTAEKEINDKKITDFCQKVVRFFFSTQSFEGGKLYIEATSHAARLIELLDYVVEGRLDKGELLAYIDRTLKNLENSFVAIAQSYASLRIRCLKS